MPEPTDQPQAPSAGAVSVDRDMIIEELLKEQNGRALWERAQWKVAADLLVNERAQLLERIRELEAQRTPASKKPTAKDTPDA